jgi:hypothetical protein
MHAEAQTAGGIPAGAAELIKNGIPSATEIERERMNTWGKKWAMFQPMTIENEVRTPLRREILR